MAPTEVTNVKALTELGEEDGQTEIKKQLTPTQWPPYSIIPPGWIHNSDLGLKGDFGNIYISERERGREFKQLKIW